MSPACGGATLAELENRLKDAFKPLEKVQLQQPSDTPTAEYYKAENAAIVYMKPYSLPIAPKIIPRLPQEAADWLYQATLCAIPLLQTLLRTQKSFNSKGGYEDAMGEPASGGQLAAFWGTEIGSRRDRALIAYDRHRL